MVCDASIWICSLSGYIDTVNTQLLQQILAAFCIAGTNRSFSDKSTVNILVIRCIKIIIYVIYEIGVNVFIFSYSSERSEMPERQVALADSIS